MEWVYRYETKGIQAWILDSNRLRDLAGGSNLVERLTATAKERAQKAGAKRIPQATSGAMTAVFPDLQALEAFAAEWPMEVARLAPGLQVVQAWAPTIKATFDKLIARKSRLMQLDPEVNPWVMRAGRSGFPAINPSRTHDSPARRTHWDAPSWAKEQARPQAGLGSADATGGLDWSHFNLEADSWECQAAVIHADGSGIGKVLMELGDDFGKLEEFSEALRDSTRAATAAAFQELMKDGVISARPVVSAGDDVTCIVRAPDARRFVTCWLQAFERETEARKDRLGGRALVGGAGIALVHPSYPFASAYAHAEDLCKAAKDRLKAKNDKRSVMAFQRVTASWVDDIRAGALGWTLAAGHDGHPPLESLVQAVRGLPRGTLRTWLTSHERGDQAQASLLWQRAHEVAAKESREAFVKALVAVGADPDTGQLKADSPVAVALSKRTTTPISDALMFRHIEKEDR